MNRCFDDQKSNRQLLLIWQEQIALLARSPARTELLRHEASLLPRFIHHYAQLKTLPRRSRRGLQRQCKRSLAGVALLLTIGAQPALAATIHVGGTCTLARAIVSANADRAFGGCASGRGADTIVLPANSTHWLSAINNTAPYGATGLPVIRGSVTIAGNNSTIRRDPNAPAFRIFALSDSSSLSLQNTTVSGGLARRQRGGAVLSYYGTLNLNNSTITGNFATVSGGGIYAEGGYVNVAKSTISNNRTIGRGGGVTGYSNASVHVTNSTISGNVARNGGGAYVDTGTTFTISNSTISGNTASRQGGGAYIDFDATLRLQNSTITGNIASQGGGLYLWRDGTLNLSASLISNNRAATDAELFVLPSDYHSGIVNAGNYNVIGHSGDANASGFVPGYSDIVPINPPAMILDPTLANNGGPTLTHPLVAGSPAIDAIVNGTCPSPEADQRGVARPQDGNGDGGMACDIGAFELAAAPVQKVFCAGLPASIVGTDGDDHIIGTPGRDVIHGLNGNDRLAGIEGDDVICGGGGDDTIYGGSGNDKLLGALGNDRLVGRDGNDVLLGSLGLDRLDGGDGRDQCDGGAPVTGDKAKNCESVSNIP
ncbi:MAG: choice-of-anchor Q domain-containing protein [Gammaproteobacteria bacterium]